MEWRPENMASKWDFGTLQRVARDVSYLTPPTFNLTNLGRGGASVVGVTDPDRAVSNEEGEEPRSSEVGVTTGIEKLGGRLPAGDMNAEEGFGGGGCVFIVLFDASNWLIWWLRLSLCGRICLAAAVGER
jgi:hypothetical protein